MTTPTECKTTNINTNQKAQDCYNLSITNRDELTQNAQWEIQNNAITNMDDNDVITIDTDDSDLNRYIIIHNTCNDKDNCITKDQWTNLKLLKAFINNYQEWKSQEEAAIQKEITEYNNRITAVTSKVDSMLASLDRMESEVGNKAKQQHMLTELSGMLSTYDRKMDVAESDRKVTDSRVKNLSNIFKLIAVAILLCIFVMIYVKRQKSKSLS